MELEGYTPRPSQRHVFDSKARFMIVDAGRRWGKTVTGLNWLLEGVCKEGGLQWWVAPVYGQSRMAFRELLSAARAGGGMEAIKDISHSEMRLNFLNDVPMEFKSADNPDNLRGAGPKRIVVDEAARVKRDVWEEVLRPAVSDTGGRILFISTPKGKNWFYELWGRGQDLAYPEFESWQFPTADNPRVPASDIEQAQQSLPIDVFEQEYLARFLEDRGGVFRNIKACMGAERSEPLKGRQYYAGLDLARLTDFTVLTIIDDQGHQVFKDRYNKLDWAVQKGRVFYGCKRYNASVLVDSTGIGDPIYDDLARMGLNIRGYKFTEESKKQLIELLMMAFEQGLIRILNDVDQFNELDNFDYTIGSSGRVHYSAPEGYHDDCVIALALANWARQHGAQIGWAFGV